MNARQRLFAFTVAISVTVGASSAMASQVIVGPVLNNENSGWANTGLQITALNNEVLQSFVFANYGQNDTIELTATNGAVLDSIAFAGTGNGIQESSNQQSSTIVANWTLTAGTTYDLISVDPSNSMWTIASFPVSNSDLTVDGGYGQGSLESSLWFHFTDLTTNSAVPEPASLALVGLGFAALLALRRRHA